MAPKPQKLPKLWKNGPTGDWHVYLGKKKVNLRTSDANVAERLRRQLKTGELTPETIPGAPPIERERPPAPLRLLEPPRVSAPPTPPETPERAAEATTDALRGAFESVPQADPPPAADGAPAAAPDGYKAADGWHQLGDPTAPEGAPEEPKVEFDTTELLDFAAQTICDLTEHAAAAVLARRNRVPMTLDAQFPLKPLLRDSWAAQLRILIPAGAPLTPAAGIAIGTLGIWFAMAAGSKPMTPEQVAERERVAREASEGTAEAKAA